MVNSTEAQLLELLNFCLPQQNPNIRAIAVKSLLPYSASAYRSLFLQAHSGKTWTAWLATCAMSEDLDALPRHDAIKCLINLTSADQSNALEISRESSWWPYVKKTISVSSCFH